MTPAGVFAMDNPVRRYPWGSPTMLPALRGETGSGEPEAEVWMGAHPDDPSRLLLPGGGASSLADLLAQDPQGVLGPDVAAREGARLPFLLKLLAAESPLSIQLHPSPGRAVEGYAAEEAAGVRRDDPARTYRDPHAKPEMLVALGPFAAMAGLRPPSQARRLLLAVGPAAASLLVADEHPDGSLEALRRLLAWPADRRRRLAEAAAECAAGKADPASSEDPASADHWTWVRRLAVRYPDDPAVLAPLLLQVIRLEDGDGLFLPAGVLHAYLYGCGVEVMGASDNVLRAGLTPKHIDIRAVLETARAATSPALRIAAVPADGVWERWPAPVGAFDLQRARAGSEPISFRTTRGAEILLCVDGSCVVTANGDDVRLGAGSSAFVPGTTHQVTVRGPATLFRCTVGLDA